MQFNDGDIITVIQILTSARLARDASNLTPNPFPRGKGNNRGKEPPFYFWLSDFSRRTRASNSQSSPTGRADNSVSASASRILRDFIPSIAGRPAPRIL